MVWNHSNIEETLLQMGAQQGVPLAELTSFRVGGPAAFVLRPQSYDAIKTAVRICREAEVPFILLGRGTNVLASDDGYDGLVIRFDTPLHEPIFDGTRVTVCCGTSLTQLARETVAKGLSGMERLCGIPGSVGGACAMNAGAYGGEIKQILRRIRLYRNGVDAWVDVTDADLGYRRSAFSFPDAGDAAQTMRACMEKRREKQPLELPSAGSTFKRPEGHFAGALIEQCGLKGVSIGGAQVSEKHAGFLVNAGGATERDISALIRHVQETVLRRTGVRLECEIKRIGKELT